MKPQVGQLRKMTVPHIHGANPVVVKVISIDDHDGTVTSAECVECPSYHHKTDKINWSMYEADDFGIVDRATKQQKQETTMENEARKIWALAQKWDKFVPKTDVESKSGNEAKDGEVWVIAYDERYRAVILATCDGEKGIVLAGKCGVAGPGDKTNFASSSLIRKAYKLVDADSTKLPMLWKRGELRFGNIHEVNTPECKTLYTKVAYKVVGAYGTYDWEIEIASGPSNGMRCVASENWDSAVVPEALMELRLGNFEVDPDAPAERPRKFMPGEIYLVREEYAPQGIKAGTMFQITKESPEIYAIGVRDNGTVSEHGYGVWDRCQLQLMRPVGRGPAAVPKGEQCGDRSAAYGLNCSERKNHKGDKHRNRERGAEWEKRDVIKLDACWYECKDAAGAAALSVGTARVVATGQTKALCLKCMNENEAAIARRTSEHDKENPQPRRQERFMVESHTLEAGGVFGIGR